MNDINISYENGLHLSELNGTLESLKYQADHIFATHASDFACVIVVWSILFSLAILCILGFSKDKPCKCVFRRNTRDADALKTRLYTYERIDTRGDGPEVFDIEVRWVFKRWICALTTCIAILIPIILVIVTYITLTSIVEMQIVDVQAQIDTIISMYEE